MTSLTLWDTALVQEQESIQLRRTGSSEWVWRSLSFAERSETCIEHLTIMRVD